MATTSAAVRQLSDKNSVGTMMGQSSTDVIGFYNVTTCVAQQAVSGSLSSGAFASSMADCLRKLGLITYTTSA